MDSVAQGKYTEQYYALFVHVQKVGTAHALWK